MKHVKLFEQFRKGRINEEVMDDLKSHTEDEVFQLIQKRWNGLQLLRKKLGDSAIDFKPFGGYEIFLKDDESSYNDCLQKLPFINELLNPLFRNDVFIKASFILNISSFCNKRRFCLIGTICFHPAGLLTIHFKGAYQ